MEYPLILISLLFITAGQFLQKLGADKAAVSQSEKPFLDAFLPQILGAVYVTSPCQGYWQER